RVTGELKKVFRPEFLNRVDEIIVFRKLSRAEIAAIVDLMMSRVEEQLKDREIGLALTPEAKDFLVDVGYDPTMGARPLRRAIQRYVEDLLAEEVLSGRFPRGSTVLLGREEDHLAIVEVIPGAPEVLVADESK
ncbi:MAG: NDP-hexose 4-ketoreductase, partial [Firmicutes bacterium]|nr:NDP-hexose 4-ketoreductase [Bacillota bacterium]